MFKSYFSENFGLSEFIYLIKVEKSIALMAWYINAWDEYFLLHNF